MCVRLIDITIVIMFFSINWKNYFDRSILVISMTVLIHICIKSCVVKIVKAFLFSFQVTQLFNRISIPHKYEY